VERLARKAVALPHERRHVAGMDEPRGTVRAARGKSASSVRREIGRSASAPSTGRDRAGPARFNRADAFANSFLRRRSRRREAQNVAIEEAARSLVARDARPSNVLRLEKELRWQQEARILSAVLPAMSAGDEKTMIVLAEDALVTYGEEQGRLELTNHEAAAARNKPAAALCARTTHNRG